MQDRRKLGKGADELAIESQMAGWVQTMNLPDTESFNILEAIVSNPMTPYPKLCMGV